MPLERIWEDADKLNLFAWLDFCLQNSLNFEDTINQHLTDLRKYRSGNNVTFTSKQVRQKIVDEARRFVGCKGRHALGLHHILETGSSAIIGLPHDLQRDIGRRVSQYTVDYPHVLSKKQPSGLQTSKPHATHRPFKDPAKMHEKSDEGQNEIQSVTIHEVSLHSQAILSASAY